MKQRNYTIDFFRLIFAICIVILHTCNFMPNKEYVYLPGAYISVEFYFIVSGYLYMKKAAEAKNELNNSVWQQNIKVIGKKYLSILPYLFLATIAGLSFTSIIAEFP